MDTETEDIAPGFDSDILIAVFYVFLACFSNALSLILMKFSIEKVEREQRQAIQEVQKNGGDIKDIKQQSSVLNKYWISGFIFILVGTFANIQAINYGSILLSASTSALTLVFNAILSIKILGEGYQCSDGVAIFFICLGSVGSLASAKGTDKTYTPAQMVNFFTSSPSVCWFGLAIICIVSAWLLHTLIKIKVKQNWFEIYDLYTNIHKEKKAAQEHEKHLDIIRTIECKSRRDTWGSQQSQLSSERSSKTLIGSTNSLVSQSEFKKVSDDEFSCKLLVSILSILTQQQIKNTTPITLQTYSRVKIPLITTSLAAGLMGSLALTFSKGALECLRTDNVFSISFLGFAFVALGIAVFQLTLLNLAMELYDQVDTIPIYQTSIIMFQIFAAAIVLEESALYTFWEFFSIVICCFLSIVGVFVIVRKPQCAIFDKFNKKKQPKTDKEIELQKEIKTTEASEVKSENQTSERDSEKDPKIEIKNDDPIRKNSNDEFVSSQKSSEKSDRKCQICDNCELNNLDIKSQLGRFSKMTEQDQRDLQILSGIIAECIDYNYHKGL